MSSRFFDQPVPCSPGEVSVVDKAALDLGEPGCSRPDGLTNSSKAQTELAAQLSQLRPGGEIVGRIDDRLEHFAATKRLRQRMMSLRVLPSVVRRAT